MAYITQLKKQMFGLLFSCLIFVVMFSVNVAAAGQENAGAESDAESSAGWIQSESAVLMEASTGKVIIQKNADQRMSPASITKIMTLLLIFEELDKGALKLTDEVTTSAYAKSMGGSQVFLEEGEVQTVETMIKCIAIASGNDASVAMAEKIAGSEAAFVEMMNEKALELGMNNTHFLDCCGLSNEDEHYTSATDVAIMSRVLITKYPQIFEYTKIWMEDMVHKTAQGESVFTLSSTNKLLRQYEYTTGLKTGSTDKAKYCFSATAEKDGLSMIAVVMAAPDYKVRFAEAKRLLEYGFEVSHLYRDEHKEKLPDIPVLGGKKEQISVGYAEPFVYLDTEGRDLSGIEKKTECLPQVSAPVKEGDIIGRTVYSIGGKTIGESKIVSYQSIEKAEYRDYLKKVFHKILL